MGWNTIALSGIKDLMPPAKRRTIVRPGRRDLRYASCFQGFGAGHDHARLTSMKRAFLTAQWRYLAMLNYTIDPAVLQPLLPPGTELDFFNDTTYVSVVGFRFLRTKVCGLPIP